jgi:hypothetical protein
VTASDLTNYAVVVSNGSGSVTSSVAILSSWASPVLQLRMPFTDAPGGTTTASDTSGGGINITMNMTTNGTIAGDLHGAAGTGVTILNPSARALDMTTNTSPDQGTNEPANGNTAGLYDVVSLLGNATLANLGGGNGNITNYVITVWVKFPAYVTFPAAVGPRFWALGPVGSGLDDNAANNIAIAYFNTNQLQFNYGTITTTTVTLPSGNFPLGQWMFFAMTYDGSNNRIYYGTDTSSVQLINTTPMSGQTVALGATPSLLIGNRGNYTRSLNGWAEDFRFYNNPGNSNFVESVRASLAPLGLPPVAATMTVQRTAGLALQISLADVATNWSDVYRYPVTLAGINLTTTNGVTLTTNSSWIFYTNSPNVADQISYTVSDGQGGTGTGLINVAIVSGVTGTNSITSIAGTYPLTTLTAYGIPGYVYVTQRATNLTPVVNWVNVSTNTAAGNGQITATDNYSDLTGPPAAAYYRLSWTSP